MIQRKRIGQLMALALWLTGSFATAAAQEEAPSADRQEVLERRVVVSRERAQASEERSAAEAERLRAAEERLQAAEERLAEAAREIAEITSGVVPGAVEYARGVIASSRRPVLGVSIGTSSHDKGTVEGVEILGVSPGSPAEEADLRAGDVLTAIGDTSLAADAAADANRRFMDALAGREPGDSIELDVLRGGKTLSVAVQTREKDSHAFAFLGDGSDWKFDFKGGAPMVWFGSARPWGDMEMVELSPELGRYFGTETGLLVVRAPSDPALKLQDGDVIRSIGGREPESVAHATRILRSYEEGEELVLDIMRDKRSRRLEVQIPASQGGIAPVPLPDLPALPGRLRVPSALSSAGLIGAPEV